jgi:hypothetical protein
MHRLLAVPLGTWVHLRNVKGHRHANGYMYCAARMKSSFEALPPTDPRVEALLQYDFCVRVRVRSCACACVSCVSRVRVSCVSWCGVVVEALKKRSGRS